MVQDERTCYIHVYVEVNEKWKNKSPHSMSIVSWMIELVNVGKKCRYVDKWWRLWQDCMVEDDWMRERERWDTEEQTSLFPYSNINETPEALGPESPKNQKHHGETNAGWVCAAIK